MSDLENDLKRVLRNKADGDYVTGADVMLDRVSKGATRLHRRRIGAVALSTLAIVTAGTTLALNLGDITDANPPVIGKTTTPPPGVTPTAVPQTAPTSMPTKGTTEGPAIGGQSTNTATTTPTITPTTPAATPKVPAGGVTVTGFNFRGVATNGENTIRVIGDGDCNGAGCYPILLSTDGGKTFQYEESAPGQAHDLGVSGDYWWTSGGSQRSIQSSENDGKTWTPHQAPGVIRAVYGQGGTPVFKIGTGSDMHFYRGGGSPYFTRIEPGLGRAHDYSVWGRAVASGDVNGMVGVVVSNSDHKPRMTPCKTTSIDTQLSAGPGDVIWLMCPTSAAAGPTLMVSSDAGKTWKTVTSDVPRPGAVNHIAAISADSALYYAGPTSKATRVRTDGSTREVVITGMAEVGELYFQTSSVGYASSYGRLMRSTDGGLTWHRVTFPAFE